jgi:predicted transcriptional regulator
LELRTGRKITKYRGSTELMDSILRSIKSGATKTHIMYEAFLSYGQLKDYLRLLQERNLIKYEEDSRLYKITERGLRFMNAYDKISELVPSTEERNSQTDEATSMHPFSSGKRLKLSMVS